MAFWVYRRHGSDGARELATALGGRRVRDINRVSISVAPSTKTVMKQIKTRKGNLVMRPREIKVTRVSSGPKQGDVVVCWGEHFLAPSGVKVLNGAVLRNKYTDAALLHEAGVPTIEVSNQPREGWLARAASHVGGGDLLQPPARPDYWSKKLDLKTEYRIHCFRGLSIRAGKKVPRIEQPHAWIRSYDAGWKIMYDGFKSSEGLRAVAAQALEALGLDFGAVDIGKTKKGEYVVLEVNRAPGCDPNTTAAYVKAIRLWATGA